MKRLETDEIQLEPYNKEHISFFKEWRDYYSHNFFGDFPESMDALLEGFNDYLREHRAGKKVWFVIYEKDVSPFQGERLPIGMIGLNDIDYKNGNCELGQMFLNQDRRGHGFMDQAINLLLRHCFMELRMVVVYLWTILINTGAIQCYERCGFKRTGEIPDALYRNGKYWSKLIMTITMREGDWDS